MVARGDGTFSALSTTQLHMPGGYLFASMRTSGGRLITETALPQMYQDAGNDEAATL